MKSKHYPNETLRSGCSRLNVPSIIIIGVFVQYRATFYARFFFWKFDSDYSESTRKTSKEKRKEIEFSKKQITPIMRRQFEEPQKHSMPTRPSIISVS